MKFDDLIEDPLLLILKKRKIDIAATFLLVGYIN